MSLIEIIVVITTVLAFAIGYTVIYLDFVKYVKEFEVDNTAEQEYCPSEESED